jgi:GNAT superfamily N-acetyltransferase
MAPGRKRVRGQKLFVRPMEPQDRDRVLEFLATQKCPPMAHTGLIGKLVGQLVVVVQLDFRVDEVQIEQMVVADHVRRKRIGRFMIDEADVLARKMERGWLTAAEDTPIAPFLIHIGFVQDAGKLRRRVVR